MRPLVIPKKGKMKVEIKHNEKESSEVDGLPRFPSVKQMPSKEWENWALGFVLFILLLKYKGIHTSRAPTIYQVLCQAYYIYWECSHW